MRNFLLLLILFFSGSLVADEVEFKASAPTVVRVGQQFQLTYTLNQDGSNLEMPQVEHFEMLGRMGPSTSSSIQIINGKMTQSYTLTYILVLAAREDGNFTIPPAKVKVGRKQYESNSVTIQVLPAGTQQQPQKQGQSQQGSTSQQPDLPSDNLFLKLHLNKTSVYQGEQVTATLKLYSKYRIEGQEGIDLPAYTGFYKQELDADGQLKQEVINGEVFLTAELQKLLLFPQRTGDLVIEPAGIDLILLQKSQQRRSRDPFGFFDDFFDNYQRLRRRIESNQVTVNVKPLPPGAPMQFKGAVGSFSLKSTISKTEAAVNDAITLKITLSGNGNLKLVDPPKIDFPPDFELYDPKTTNNINNTAAGQSGSKTFDYLFIPRHAGNFRIAPVEFSYFDLASKSYKTIRSNEFNLVIQKGDQSNAAPIVAGLSKEDIRFIGSDILFIKNKTVFKRLGDSFAGSLLFYLLYPAALLLTLAIILLRRKQIKENANVWVVKNKKARKLAQKRLKQAAQFMKQEKREQFYEEISRGMWGYLSDKLGIPVAELSRDNAHQALINCNISDELINDCLGIIDDSEFARYAPSSVSVAMDEIYKRAIKAVITLEQKLK